MYVSCILYESIIIYYLFMVEMPDLGSVFQAYSDVRHN